MNTEEKRTGATPKKKVCERCGTEFDCFSPQEPCWCEGVKLSSNTLAALRAKFDDCLCPQCLESAAQNKTA